MSALYGARVIERGKHPRFRADLEARFVVSRGENASCGDRITMGRDPLTRELRFEGRACLLCRASADLACEALSGKTDAEAATLIDSFLRALETGDFRALEGLEPLAAARSVPVRLGCVRLPWETSAKLVGEA